jgi:hypothetical protein
MCGTKFGTWLFGHDYRGTDVDLSGSNFYARPVEPSSRGLRTHYFRGTRRGGHRSYPVVASKPIVLLTPGVPVEANDPRHADKNASHKTKEEAEQSIEFTEALAEILFVLPSRVRRGIERATAFGLVNVTGSATPRLVTSDQQT